ncbi:MAG: M23 family metallopeptidase [Sphingobacteriales bacterium]|nr:M23 family metallopeptidase [Sphingobacteriales bacterium]
MKVQNPAQCFFLIMSGWLFSLQATSQPVDFNKIKYYFRNPLGIPMQVQANLGEMRSDHWHMGLDIRTDQKENQPVYAAADGYIASIGIRPQSFGRFIIINHPNGLSTLYAHLNDFYPELEEYVTRQQYEKKSWAIELKFSKEQFPVNKSQFIAFSGNTGGSQGPHLHFEIFDTKTDKRLNPLLLGFPLEDDIRPTIVKLAMYDRSRSVYGQSPTFFSIKSTDSGYIIPKIPVIKTGLNKLSFAIQTYDKMNNSKSQDGIYSAKLFFDDELLTQFVMDSIDYDETLYINAQADYTYRHSGGAWLQHLSQLPGDHGSVYKQVKGNGVIELSDTDRHRVKIEVRDAYKNIAELNFNIRYDDSLAVQTVRDSSIPTFFPNIANEIEKSDFEMMLPASALYDTVQALYYRNNSSASNSVSAIHRVNDASVPLHNDVSIRIKPTFGIPDEWKNKIIIQRNSGGNNIRKAIWDGQWLTAKFGDFGTYQAFVDLLPPKINELGKPARLTGGGDTVDLSPASRIIITPADNFGAIKNFRAELDSQWIRFTNDKGRNWIYQFDDRCPFGIHHLKVTVEDLVGNSTTREWWFKRYPYTPPKKKKVLKKKGSVKKKGKGK